MSKVYETLLAMTKPSDLCAYAEHVIEWNHVAYRARNNVATPFDLQWGFIREEFNELVDALRVGDRIETVDAACDLFVVASYACQLKSPEYLREACTPSPTLTFTIGDLEHNLYGNMQDPVYVLKLVTALCYRLDINLDYNMQQVLHSNDTKYPYLQDVLALWPDKEHNEALRLECKAIEDRSNGRYSGVRCHKVYNAKDPGSTDPRLVFFDNNGKIMKPSTFESPKIIA
jgi:hypothetical protein